jgi:hypothetical protein
VFVRWDGVELIFIVIKIGLSHEQIEGWKIMLEKNVSYLANFNILWG